MDHWTMINGPMLFLLLASTLLQEAIDTRNGSVVICCLCLVAQDALTPVQLKPIFLNQLCLKMFLRLIPVACATFPTTVFSSS